jgi:hypothetical protein
LDVSASLSGGPAKKDRRQKKKRLTDTKKELLEIEFNSATFGTLTGFSVSFSC